MAPRADDARPGLDRGRAALSARLERLARLHEPRGSPQHFSGNRLSRGDRDRTNDRPHGGRHRLVDWRHGHADQRPGHQRDGRPQRRHPSGRRRLPIGWRLRWARQWPAHRLPPGDADDRAPCRPIRSSWGRARLYGRRPARQRRPALRAHRSRPYRRRSCERAELDRCLRRHGLSPDEDGLRPLGLRSRRIRSPRD